MARLETRRPGLLSRFGKRKPAAVPMPPDFYSGPPDARAYANLPAQLDGVRIEPPRACDSRTLEYPRELIADGRDGRSTVPRPRLPYDKMAFFRAESLDPKPQPWP